MSSTVRLGERAALTVGHVGPMRERYVADGVPFLRSKNVLPFRIDLNDIKYIDEAFHSELGKSALAPGDVVVVRTGQPGVAAVIPSELSVANCSDLVIIRPGPELDARYLAYYINGAAQGFVDSRTVGAVQQHFNIGAARELPLPDLNLKEQQAIAGVLGALDDLIDTDQRLANRLDEQVRLVGRRFIDSVAGHSSMPMMEIADIDKGYSYKSAELVQGGGQWLVNLKNVGRDGAFQERGFKPLAGNPKERHFVDNGDVVVAQTDLTQAREVIARPVRVRRFGLLGEMVASLDLVRVRPKNGLSNEFVFAVLDHPNFRSHALGYCNGTTVLHMAARAIPDYLAPLPDKGMIADFTASVRPLRAAADALLEEIAQLSRTRHELLPLLLSGRVLPGEVAEDG